MEKISRIRQTIFSQLSEVSGGAICINKNVNLEIIECILLSCGSIKEGGAIYFAGVSFTFQKNCIELCYIQEKIDDLFGNVIYSISSSSTTYSNSVVSLSSPSHFVGSDSNLLINSEVSSTMTKSNFSFCSCPFGPSSTYFRGNEASVKDVTLFQGIAGYAFYSDAKSTKISMATIVGLQIYPKTYLFFSVSTIMQVDNSLIMSNCTASQLAKNVKFSDCKGNVTTTGISIFYDSPKISSFCCKMSFSNTKTTLCKIATCILPLAFIMTNKNFN